MERIQEGSREGSKCTLADEASIERGEDAIQISFACRIRPPLENEVAACKSSTSSLVSQDGSEKKHRKSTDDEDSSSKKKKRRKIDPDFNYSVFTTLMEENNRLISGSVISNHLYNNDAIESAQHSVLDGSSVFEFDRVHLPSVGQEKV
eukprot:CAMPEP_0115034006 /NCGR_PEP_ID=MMETSP0216-20121206/40319_1 /TAXON_ID=223996 /ORGANISM="Protocruzia adherens, Strain Boccale" /LENGTH=148 /DNA_ID=CAMNT_0002412659 /DNA_START=94 /DNA_END=536 /DNA_ORIENTATION=-